MSGSPKIFTAKLREMAERFDPRYVAFRRRTAEFHYPMARLSELLSALPEYGAGEAGIERTDRNQPRYIRITDINDDGELSSELGATAETIEARYFLEDGDLLFARSGATVGKCYLHETDKIDYPCFYAGYMMRFRFNDTVLPKYVFAFAQTSYYRDWVAAIQRSAGQPNINAQEYCSLQIPVPPLDVQRLIVAELDVAYEAKRKADEKATQLLASIDDIVLSELGISKLPPQDTSLKARMFVVSSKQMVDSTLAPKHYFSKLDFSASRYPCIRFSDIIDIDPLERSHESREHCPFVPMENVSAVYGAIEQIETVVGEQMDGYSVFRNGDVIWAKITPCMENGKSAVVETDDAESLYGSTEFMVFRPRPNKITSRYLHSLLRLKWLRDVAAHHFSGSAGHQRVTAGFFKNLLIPVPPCKIQEKLVAKVNAIYEEAKRLKSAAAEALASAKSSMGAKILGE